MDVTDPLYQRALLYLRAAGHKTGARTRLRLQEHFNRCRADRQDLTAATLLPQLHRWFDLPAQAQMPAPPRLVRGSIGYPGG